MKKFNLASLAVDELKIKEMSAFRGGSGNTCVSKGCGSDYNAMWRILHSNLLKNNPR